MTEKYQSLLVKIITNASIHELRHFEKLQQLFVIQKVKQFDGIYLLESGISRLSYSGYTSCTLTPHPS